MPAPEPPLLYSSDKVTKVQRQLNDVVLVRDDGLDLDDRRHLRESIRQDLEDGRAGRVSDFGEFLDELELQS